MSEFWTIPTTNVLYTRSQNCTNMVVGEHGIQTFKVVLVVLLLLLPFDILVLTSGHPLLFFDKCFNQIYTLNSIISTPLMSLLLYTETLGNGCS